MTYLLQKYWPMKHSYLAPEQIIWIDPWSCWDWFVMFHHQIWQFAPFDPLCALMKVLTRSHCTGKLPAGRSSTKSASWSSELSVQTFYPNLDSSLAEWSSASKDSVSASYYFDCRGDWAEFESSGSSKQAFWRTRPDPNSINYWHGLCPLPSHSYHACCTWCRTQLAGHPSP